MIDFTEIEDSETWELFSRDFLQEIGFYIESSPDRGPDGGKDILVTEELSGNLGNYKFRWLVSCKHNAKSGISVKEEVEQNILERVAGFNADGFVGFYSTIASAGLNNRLKQIKEAGKIKDFRIFDQKLIENYLIRIGFSELVMRYFPKSYKAIKPLHQIANEYIPLKCKNCNKDILEEMYEKSYNAIISFVTKRDQENSRVHIQDIYWACKGECNRELEKYYWDKYQSTTKWEDISDLIIPSLFLRWIMGTLNNLRSERWVYSDEAFDKGKDFIMALSQKVFREMTKEEKKRAVDKMNFMNWINV